MEYLRTIDPAALSTEDREHLRGLLRVLEAIQQTND